MPKSGTVFLNRGKINSSSKVLHRFFKNNINISLLCGGTRNKAGWEDEELAVGFPFNRFLAVADGIYKTVNAMEPNNKKARIEEKPPVQSNKS